MVCTMPASDSGRLAGTATRGVLFHHPRAGSRVRTACGTCHLSPPPRLVCDLPHGCFASAPQTPWQHTCTCCLVPPCATVYRASYRALYRLEPPCVSSFVPLCRGLLSVASDLASPIDRMGARLTAQTSRRKLALVAHRHGPAVRAERNRRILHIPDGQRAPKSCAHATLGTGRPLPAYSRRLASLQAVEPFELCAWDVPAPRGCSGCLRPGTPQP
jgi:hypothetical protein